MIGFLQKKSLKLLHPLLKRMTKYYLSKPRQYTHEGIKLKVYPSVFHPGLFFSTKAFISFLKTLDLKNKAVLELGAGSGLISFYGAQNGAEVIATDINESALQGINENAATNHLKVHTVFSDLFDKVPKQHFDFILVNPPYYPKKPKSIEEEAWFCGEEFEYFLQFFKQLREIDFTKVFMILSDDCELDKIKSIGSDHDFHMDVVYTKVMSGEKNYIFQVAKMSK